MVHFQIFLGMLSLVFQVEKYLFNCSTRGLQWNGAWAIISLGDYAVCANFVGFRGSVPLLPHLCPLSVPKVGLCGVFSESP